MIVLPPLLPINTLTLDKLQDDTARKRRTVSSSGKTKIMDKQTGESSTRSNNSE